MHDGGKEKLNLLLGISSAPPRLIRSPKKTGPHKAQNPQNEKQHPKSKKTSSVFKKT
jgi:hypothetical protein